MVGRREEETKRRRRREGRGGERSESINKLAFGLSYDRGWRWRGRGTAVGVM